MNAINLIISGCEFFISRKMSQHSTHASVFSAVYIWHGILLVSIISGTGADIAT
jgi:hypothetical protein